ncbi:MAG: lysophospholipid acyltransferase family protein [Paracoccaceae bacterium]|jgi:KDO2-lipid IV(A) lauroyltransferase
MPVAPSKLSRLQKAGYFSANLFLRGLIGGLKLIPYHWRVPIMGRLVRFVAPVIGFNKRVRRNLALARPDLAEADIRRICSEVADNVGRTAIELYAGEPFLKRASAADVTGPGLAALERARAEGRPVILVTGHFGNYDSARANLIARGHKMGALYRRMKNPYFNEHYVETISAIGKPMFEQGRRGMVELVRHLKGGGIVAIVADLHVQNGKEIQFFGKPAITSVVPAEMALKYNAELIPVYGIRKSDGLNFSIIMQDPIVHSDPDTMTQTVTTKLEQLVREHMGQWFWVHRRWKYRKGMGVKPEDWPDF